MKDLPYFNNKFDFTFFRLLFDNTIASFELEFFKRTFKLRGSLNQIEVLGKESVWYFWWFMKKPLEVSMSCI